MKKILSLLTIFTLWATLAMGATANVSWPTNTETDLAGYELHYGASGVLGTVLDAGNATAVQLTVPDGETCYALLAYDTTGQKSALNQEVCVDPQPAVPGQHIVTITVTITVQ